MVSLKKRNFMILNNIKSGKSNEKWDVSFNDKNNKSFFPQ